MKSDLEAAHLSSEAEKKEVNILNLSLKQKDAEIERLKELTRYMMCIFCNFNSLSQGLLGSLLKQSQKSLRKLIRPSFRLVSKLDN